MLSFTLLEGEAAVSWAQENESAWTALLADCTWSTPYVAPEFSVTWWTHYSTDWHAALVFARAPDGELRGVMPLARQGKALKGVGANQAEYQGWVCRDSDSDAFAKGALALLAERYPHHRVELRYVLDAPCLALLERGGTLGKRTLLRTHHRPLLEVNSSAVAKALRKKGNKSKLSRLRRLGALSFRRLRTAEELAAVFDDFIAAYDFRQGAQYDVMRFADDTRKADFHLDWMRRAPDQLYVTAMMLNERIAAAMICVRSRRELHLAMSCYRPELSAHSPGKLLVYETARMAAADGLQLLDLTPGGDTWKDAMATQRQPTTEALIYANALQAQLRRPREYLRTSLRRALWARGLPPHRIKQQVVRALRMMPEQVAERTRALVRPRPTHLIYHQNPSAREYGERPPGLAVNSLQAVNAFATALPKSYRQAFLVGALERLAAGERIYTLEHDGRIVSSGWLAERDECQVPGFSGRFALPRPAPMVLELLTLSAQRRQGHGRQLLEGMLQDMAEAGWRDSYLCVRSDNAACRKLVERAGFRLLAQLGRPAASSDGNYRIAYSKMETPP